MATSALRTPANVQAAAKDVFVPRGLPRVCKGIIELHVVQASPHVAEA